MATYQGPSVAQMVTFLSYFGENLNFLENSLLLNLVTTNHFCRPRRVSNPRRSGERAEG